MAKKRATRKKVDLPYVAEGLRPLAVPIGEIGEDPRNARTHGEANLAAIAASLGRFGQLKPAVGNRVTGRLEAGHGMLAAARQLGWSHLAVVWVEHSEADARDFGLADNRTAELAEWDAAVLDELLEELRAEDDGQAFLDAMLLADLEAAPMESATVDAADPATEESAAGDGLLDSDKDPTETTPQKATLGRDGENVTFYLSAEDLAMVSEAIDQAKDESADLLEPPGVDGKALALICQRYLAIVETE